MATIEVFHYVRAEDLDAIRDFIAQNSPANADKMAERILAAIGTLGSFPYRTLVEHAPPSDQASRSLTGRKTVRCFLPCAGE